MWETLLRTAASFPWEQVLMPKGKPGKTPTEASDQKHLERRAQELARRVQAGHMTREAAVEELRHEIPEASGPASPSPVSTPETVAYQNREISKTLLAMETHLSQGCRISTTRGKLACDCCSGRHPLELEKYAEEAQAMSPDPVYIQLVSFAREVEAKANVQAVEGGQYASEYPAMARQARDLRKRLR